MAVQIKYPNIGICGLSCRLCPTYHTEGKSRCGGCKSHSRMAVGCPFITCAIKRKGIEFCWQCPENEVCDKWGKHRAFSQEYDTFTCYQKLDANIVFIQEKGISAFDKEHKIREKLLKDMLVNFNEGRSKRKYCIAATVFRIKELEAALSKAKLNSAGADIKEKSKMLHSILGEIAEKKQYTLKLRK